MLLSPLSILLLPPPLPSPLPPPPCPSEDRSLRHCHLAPLSLPLVATQNGQSASGLRTPIRRIAQNCLLWTILPLFMLLCCLLPLPMLSPYFSFPSSCHGYYPPAPLSMCLLPEIHRPSCSASRYSPLLLIFPLSYSTPPTICQLP